jgi:deoxyribonuclease IV
MLIGAHVSQAGGLEKAVERGLERDCDAIQIFNQSPRMWRPTGYGEDDYVAFRRAIRGTQIKAVLIHAVYLINCASEDRDIRKKSLTSLVHSLQVGDGIAATGVVLHPGSAKKGDVRSAINRAGAMIKRALGESDHCPLYLEDTAGAGGTLGRSFEELSELLEAAGGDARLGLCLDSCHLFASGYDVSTPEGLRATLDECNRLVGLDRLHALHLNDSMTPLGSNRDRHALLGEGELGDRGCANFVSEPRFARLPCVLETGRDGGAPATEDVAKAKKLLAIGKASRRRKAQTRKNGSPARRKGSRADASASSSRSRR